MASALSPQNTTLLPDLLVRHRDPRQCRVLPPFPQRDRARIAQSGTPAQPDARGVPAHRAPVVTGQDPQVLPCVAHSASVLRPQEAPQEGAVSTGGAGPVTHELGKRPAIADRRERVGEGEGDTVAGRMSGAIGHPGAAGPPGGAWWAARPPPNARSTSHCSIEQALAPHTAAPSPWTGATSSPPGPALQEPLGAPVHFCQARCPWQRGTNENTNGLLREYFPKRTPLDGTNPTRTQQVHNQLNQRPRKRLGWKTPEEAHTHRTLHFL